MINRLHDALEMARAYAAAIRDNAQDERLRIPAELVASFTEDLDAIAAALHTAATL